MKSFLGAFLSHRLATVGASITLTFIVASVAERVAGPYGATDADFAALLSPPSWAHPFGTDSFGRDVLMRVLIGAQVSFAVSVAGVAFAMLVGTTAGLLAAYRGGIVEFVIMRVADLLFSFPSFVLALFLMVILGFGATNISIAIALIYVPIFARLARNLGTLVLHEPWVQAARLFGQSTRSIITREILPNIAAPLMVQATLGIAFGIVIEAGLSFLGLGVQPPRPSLGTIMADGREYFGLAPWVITMTGVAISTVLLGLNLLGDGLRDLTDPKLRGRL
jgi:peptide/nickel transport system permease protein